MKDIRVKKTNLIIEKKIEKETFLYECVLDNLNTKKFIKKINEGIETPDNMNYKTNVNGFMTGWQYFIKDVELNSLLSLLIDYFKLDKKIMHTSLCDAWGNKMVRNGFTMIHDHGDSALSGVLFLNTCKGQYLEFPELNIRTDVIKNKIVLFKGLTSHRTNRITDAQIKYAISFNFQNLNRFK